MDPIISDIQAALNNGQAFDINKSEQSVKPLPFIQRLFLTQAQESARIGRIAKEIKRSLNTQKTLSCQSPQVRTAKLFLKLYGKKWRSNHQVKKCENVLLAAKLGLDTKILSLNSGFKKFARVSYLEKYLKEYSHSLVVKGNEIYICQNNKLTPWQEVNIPLPKKETKWPWLYGQSGVQNKSLFEWQAFEPYKTEENPSWKGHYLFEFCTCHEEVPGLTGDHSWIRLKTPDGKIYSTGLYREGKRGTVDNFHFPMRVKKGYLMSPDVSEFWPTTITTIAYEIDEKQFLKLKESVEKDKISEESRIFTLGHQNCTAYANQKAKMIGIKLPTSAFFIRNFVTISLQEKFDNIFSKLPSIVKKICKTATTIFFNLLQLTLGANITDSSLKGKLSSEPKLFKSPLDLFDFNKLRLHIPRLVALKIKPQIDKWRAIDPEKRKWDLPNVYKVV